MLECRLNFHCFQILHELRHVVEVPLDKQLSQLLSINPKNPEQSFESLIFLPVPISVNRAKNKLIQFLIIKLNKIEIISNILLPWKLVLEHLPLIYSESQPLPY